MTFLKLLKAMIIFGMVLLQWGVVILNLNRYGIFQNFVEVEWYEKHPKKEKPLPMYDPYEPNLFT